MLPRLNTYLVTLLLVIFAALPSHAAGAGTASGNVLTITPDARSAGMGEAYTAVTGDISSMHYNPAGLASFDHSQIIASNNRLLEGINYQHMGFAYSLRDLRISNLNNTGTLAGTYSRLTSGDIIGRDASGNATGNYEFVDQVLSIGYGKVLYESLQAGTVMGGVSGKLITEELQTRKYDNITVDAGALWKIPNSLTTVGASVMNFGNRMKYVSQDFATPTVMRLGISQVLLPDSLLVAADAAFPQSAPSYVALGTEYRFNALALRLGYNNRYQGTPGFSAGFGIILSQVDFMFMYAREIQLDYAFVPSGDLGDTHRMTLVVKIGAD